MYSEYEKLKKNTIPEQFDVTCKKKHGFYFLPSYYANMNWLSIDYFELHSLNNSIFP